MPCLVTAWTALACSGRSGETCADGPGDDGDLTTTVDAGAPGFSILLYTYTSGYRHASIPDGIRAIRRLGAEHGFSVDIKGSTVNARGSYCANQPADADRAYVTATNLAGYAAVVFLSTTTTSESTLLDESGKLALEGYVRGGGGFVGIHAAADAEYGWEFYGELVGARFLAHGPPVTASLQVEDASHPATAGLPSPWQRFDEWYDFRDNPRRTAHVLVSLDEATYPNNPSPMGDHPIAWCKTIDAGRSFYTGVGHTPEAFADSAVRGHLLGGILYAARAIAADCTVEAAAVW